MNDVLPDEIGRWHHLERVFRDTVERYGYCEVRTPIVEPTSLFERSIGEATDIVEKEMYSFERHGDALTLRPEGTAGVVRAYVEHHVSQREPVTRWYYFGPMFRGERPARGRYRQFHQLGCELYGDAGPAADAEMIDMLHRLFCRLGIDDLQVVLNSLGGPGTRPRYRNALVEHLTPLREKLSDDSKRRLQSNPLRILDSKDPRDIEALARAPSVLELLDGDDLAHWQQLRAHLDGLGTPYRVDAKLVRGLDYYTRTLFELQSRAGEVGAQNALGGGGRYDGLVEQVGGAKTPAIGFALGVERILLAMTMPEGARERLCVVAPVGARATTEALVLSRELRECGLRVDCDCRGGSGSSLKAMLRRANSLGARICMVMGDSELDASLVQVKDLEARTQTNVARTDVVQHVQRALLAEPEVGGAV
ncbi:MAG: histidine--tRNA ligase [Polyangiaceae bacterium]|nr:histidine--tRNA ligase [Polyangiaceae bacterium]